MQFTYKGRNFTLGNLSAWGDSAGKTAYHHHVIMLDGTTLYGALFPPKWPWQNKESCMRAAADRALKAEQHLQKQEDERNAKKVWG